MNKLILLLNLCILHGFSLAQDDLSEQLDSLQMKSNEIPEYVSEKKIYSVQPRYSRLDNRHEVSFNGAYNLTPESHLESTQVGAAYRFHLNHRWSFGLKYQKVNNALSRSGEELFSSQLIVPDTDYAENTIDGFATFRTFYGKIKVGQSIVYFDHFVTAGFGEVALANNRTNLYVFDTGFAFWIADNFSTRVGLRNEFYQLSNRAGKRDIRNSLGYMEFGYLFGEG